tara:strand:- start:2073 stop:2579 length:507 start_codon:yes stop_codon:yes gene_type:complete
MIKAITDLLGGGLLKGVEGIAKTFFGSKEQRDTAAHQEQMTVMQAFAAEFNPRDNRTWWDSFVDGLNRLPRPCMTFGVVGLFVYAVMDPIGFNRSMVALQSVPEYLWALFGTIIVFWFGGKFMGGMKKVTMPDPEKLSALLKTMDDMEEKRAARKLRLEREAQRPPTQ